ncbi:hypothetical protein RYX36_034561 [Vicia faba]
MDQNNLITGGNSVVEIDEVNHSDDSSNIQDKELSSENDTVRTNISLMINVMKNINTNGEIGHHSMVKQSMFSHQRLRYRKEFQPDEMPIKWSDRRQYATVSDNGGMVGKTKSRHYGESMLISSSLISEISLYNNSNNLQPSPSSIHHLRSQSSPTFSNVTTATTYAECIATELIQKRREIQNE